MKAAAALAALVVISTVPSHAQQASLRTVLERASTYVSDFENQLGGIVVEEHYLQEVVPPGPFNGALAVSGGAQGRIAPQPPTVRTTGIRTYRDLRSDLLLVHPINASRWVQFRDVFEMDHAAVHDRNDRLEKLFLKPSANIAEQAHRIQDESSRYNIGDLQRTINVPVLPLMFLEDGLQPRFDFTRILDAAGTEKPYLPKGVPDESVFYVPAGSVEVQYEEKAGGALIHTTADRPLLAHGRFWIDPTTGSVFLTEMILDDPLYVYGIIHVAYRLNGELGFMVPQEMREHYVVKASGYEINGTATYSKFRQFQVAVDEELDPAAPPAR